MWLLLDSTSPLNFSISSFAVRSSMDISLSERETIPPLSISRVLGSEDRIFFSKSESLASATEALDSATETAFKALANSFPISSTCITALFKV